MTVTVMALTLGDFWALIDEARRRAGLGEAAYERTLVEPDWLADLPADDPLEEWYFEDLYAVASRANEEAGEGELEYYPTDHGAMLGEPCGTEDAALASRFPRLWARFSARSRALRGDDPEN